MPYPGKYNKVRHKLIVDALKKGAFLKTACKAAGVSHQNVLVWRKKGAGEEGNEAEHAKYRQFAIEVDKAIVEGELAALAQWQEVAQNGAEEITTEKVYEYNEAGERKLVREVEKTTRKKDWRASQKLLSTRHHPRWGDRQKLEHQGEITHTQEVYIYDGPAMDPEEMKQGGDDGEDDASV